LIFECFLAEWLFGLLRFYFKRVKKEVRLYSHIIKLAAALKKIERICKNETKNASAIKTQTPDLC